MGCDIACRGAGSLLGATVDRFESIKGLGVEAKTLVKRAETTLAELQELAEVFANQILTYEIRAGRLSGGNDDQHEKTKDKVLQMLKRIGVPDARLPNILREWDDTIEFDYAYFTLRAAGRAAMADITPAHHQTLNDLAKGGFERRQTPAALRTALQSMNLVTPNIDAYLADYAHFAVTGSIVVFKSGGDVPSGQRHSCVARRMQLAPPPRSTVRWIDEH